MSQTQPMVKPIRPARPPANVDRGGFRAYRLAEHAYRRQLAAYIAAGGRP